MNTYILPCRDDDELVSLFNFLQRFVQQDPVMEELLAIVPEYTEGQLQHLMVITQSMEPHRMSDDEYALATVAAHIVRRHRES